MRSDDITFVVLAKDEAANIAGCLGSTLPGSHKLLYDAESKDATREIARECGACVTTAPWQGFVAARTAAAALVQTPWTFMLDADERLTQQLADELVRLEPPPGVDAFSIARKNIFCGRWIRGAGWWPDRLARLFRTGRGVVRPRAGMGSAVLHEQWIVEAATLELNAPLEHRSYLSTAAYREKFARYTDVEASGRRASFIRAASSWIPAAARFAWLYFARGGIFDGWQGLYVSAGSAIYPAVVETKAWRRMRR